MPAGSSPFHAKGHVYLKMFENMEASVPGGLAAVVARCEEPSIAAFVAQRFTAGGWYDALPITPLGSAHARILGKPFHPFIRDKGRIIAREDVPGIYRALLKLFSPELLVGKLPRAAALYFDFGKTRAEVPRPRAAQTFLAGVPYTLAASLSATIEGFMEAALEISGARGVHVRTLEASYDGGEVGGIATAIVSHEATWS